MLEETDTTVCISTIKHKLKSRLAREKPLLQNRHKKARLRLATAHGDKGLAFWRIILWSDQTKTELFGNHHYVWRKKKKSQACKPKNTILNVKSGGVDIMLCGALLQKGLVHFTT